MTGTRFALGLMACLALGLAGCKEAPQPSVSVTDSAGVHVTMSADTRRIFARVDSQPLLSLGGADAVGPTQFYRVQNVQLARGDELRVADGQSGEVRIFGLDGSHRNTIGGRGSEPGEFERIRMLGSFRGDSVAVWDDANARLTVFDAEGELGRTLSVVSRGSPLPRAFDIFNDGSILAQIPIVLQAGSLAPGQILADTAKLVRIDLDHGTRSPVGHARGPLWLWTGRSQVAIPFTINASFDIDEESIHLVAGPAFRIWVLEGGELAEVYGVERDPRNVTREDVAAYRSTLERLIPEPQQHDYLQALASPLRPSLLPAYSRIVVASDGNVWTLVFSAHLMAAGTWDVYLPNRNWVGQVQTPAGLIVTSIAGDLLAGVWRDDMGVEHVRVYRIRPG
jgi:hypothetical protein